MVNQVVNEKKKKLLKEKLLHPWGLGKTWKSYKIRSHNLWYLNTLVKLSDSIGKNKVPF